MGKDQDFMQVALDVARLGLGRTSPNPAVGAVIVKKGKIIATGFHKKAGMPHAEVEALNAVGANLRVRPGQTHRSAPTSLRNAILYVTLEPCCHHGRTPPCTDAIIRSGIKNVIVGMKDPDRKVAGKGIQILRRAGVKAKVGVLEKECKKLNEAYIKQRKTGMPFVTLKAAMTLDGKVGLKNRKQLWLTGPEARELAHVLRDRHDAILVGVDTILSDNPRLTTRLVKGKDPIRIVLDSNLRIPLSSKILHLKSKAPTWIATILPSHHPRVKSLKRIGIEILSCRKNSAGKVDLGDLLRQLGTRGILTLLVEGGPTIWRSFLRKKYVDRLVFFMSPQILGGKGLSFLDEKQLERMTRNLSIHWVGQDLCLEGNI